VLFFGLFFAIFWSFFRWLPPWKRLNSAIFRYAPLPGKCSVDALARIPRHLTASYPKLEGMFDYTYNVHIVKKKLTVEVPPPNNQKF